MDIENEGVASTTNDDDKDIEENLKNTEEETEETSEETEEEPDVDALQEKNKNLFARAKKAETELKKLKTAKKDGSSTEEAEDTPYLTKDEAVLIAKGMELEEMDKLKVIQKGMGGTLKEAYDSDLYQSHIKQKEAEDKRKKAQLGTSGKSGTEDEGFNKPNMTEEEHRALWKKNR